MKNEIIDKAKKTIKFGEFKSEKPLAILLMGLPGTGKSYLANYLNKKYSFTVLSGENITHAIFGTIDCTSDQYGEAYGILHYLAINLLKKKYNIIIDGTNLKYEFRKQYYNTFQDTSKTILIYLYNKDEVLLKRANIRKEDYNNSKMIISKCPPETFATFKKQLELPQKNEKYYQVKSDKKLFEKIDTIITNIMKE